MDTQTEQPISVAAQALAQYRPTDAAIAEMRDNYMPIRVAGVEDKAGAAKAHDARMIVKGHRVAIEKTRVALKADALEYGRKVDAEAKRLTAMLEPIEAHLLAQEEIVTKEAERKRLAEEARRAEVLRGRMASLAAVRSPLIQSDVAAMTDEQFAAALDKAAADYNAALEAERAAAEARRLESERLAAERAELDRQREQAALERAEAEREAARQRAEQEAERRRIEAERAALEAEKARIAREAEIKAAQERAAAEALERQRIEAERVKAEQAAKEAMRPAIEKVRAIAVECESLADTVPDFKAADEVRAVLNRAAQEIRAIAAR